MSANFVDPALLMKILNSFLHLAPCELLDYLPQLGVLLPHDLFQLHRLHASILQLCEGAPSLDGLVLSPISDQQDSIVRT
jgi:hypothetical protein